MLLMWGPIALFHKLSDGRSAFCNPTSAVLWKCCVCQTVRESMAKEHHAAPPSPSIPTNTLQDAWPRFDAQRVPGANETQRGGGEITDATYQGLPSAAPRASGIRGRPWLSVYHEMEDGTYFCLFITRVSISVFSFCVHVFIFRSHIYQFYVEPRKAGIYLKVVIPLFFVIRMQQTNIG